MNQLIINPVSALGWTLLHFVIACIALMPSGMSVAAEPDPAIESAPTDIWKFGERMPEQVINKVPKNVLTYPITIVGYAKNSDGKPIAGAKIYVASHGEFHKLLKTTTTDKDGKYAFRDLHLPIEVADGDSSLSGGSFEVYGTADGYAFAWRSQKGFYPDLGGNTIMNGKSPDGPGHFVGEETIRLHLTFSRPAPLTGTIVDENGNPISNAKVHLFNCWKAPNEEFSDSRMAQFDMSSLYSSDYCPPEVSTVRTNAKGEFAFSNAPPECRYRISVKPPGFASRMMYATTESEPKPDVDKRRTFFSKGTKLERNGMRLAFDSPREVQIELVGLAKPEHGDGAFVNPHNRDAGASAVSNKQGIASMKLPPGEYKVSILPPINTPYWKTDRKITVTKELKQSFELELTPAAVVDVQVVDESGDPMEGAGGFDLWVEKEYRKKAGNVKRQKDIHSFRNYERETNTCHVHRLLTDAKGQMRANFLPGKYRIGIGRSSSPLGWSVIDDGKEVELKAGETTKVTMRVRPPR